MGAILRTLVVCALAALGGCTLVSARLALDTPGSFRGALPCERTDSDESAATACEDVEATLTLRDDGLYFFRERKPGADPRTAIELGRWRLVDFNQRLLLEGATPRVFRVVTPSRLQEEGVDAKSASPVPLDRVAEMDSIGGPFVVRGNYTHLADAARITECGTGRSFPIAMAGESLELERAYLAARVVTGAPMLVTFEGRLARVNRMDTAGEEDAFVVDRFERIWPSATCSTRLSLPLVGPRWRLEEIDGVANDAQEGAPELAFAENGRVTGSSGCNRINGTYTRHDDALTFGALASTRRACVEPTRAELEQRFGAMLGEVNGLRLERTRLMMMRGADVVSRFVATE